MDYEKKYKEALERAKDFMNDKVHYALRKGENIMCWIFPELRETEDEKIRKYLLKLAERCPDDSIDFMLEVKKEDVIAWLEKQNKENMIEALRMEYEKGKGDALQEQRKEWTAEDLLNRNEIIDILQEYNRDDLIAWLEKQGESKFESCIQEGDKIVANDDGTHFNVSQLERTANKVTESKETAKKFLKSAEIMDGNDELADEYRLEKQKPTTNLQNLTWEDIEKIGEFINMVQYENPNGIGAKCLYTDVLERFLDGKQTKQKPQRMVSGEAKEALYDKPTWSEEDEEMLYSILNVINGGRTSIPTSKYTNWLKSFKDRVQPQPKQEWSKDDDSKIESICRLLKTRFDKDTCDEVGFTRDKMCDYLSSLKNKIKPQWKPSEEQIKDFGGALLILKLQHYASSESLESLYEQLKKL